MYFMSPSVGKLSIQQLSSQIEAYMLEDPNAKYKVVIGTDSQTAEQQTLFVTALIIHRVGHGAKLFYRKLKSKPVTDLRTQIYKETQLSLELMDVLKESSLLDLVADWPLEIHLDIGQQGETRKLIQEVVGWVTSIGYIAKIKPYSYGASSVADKFTK